MCIYIYIFSAAVLPHFAHLRRNVWSRDATMKKRHWLHFTHLGPYHTFDLSKSFPYENPHGISNISRFRLRPRVRKQVEERHGFLWDGALGTHDQAQEEPRNATENPTLFRHGRSRKTLFVPCWFFWGLSMLIPTLDVETGNSHGKWLAMINID